MLQTYIQRGRREKEIQHQRIPSTVYTGWDQILTLYKTICNSLSHEKISEWSKVKAFACIISNVTQNIKLIFQGVENRVQRIHSSFLGKLGQGKWIILLCPTVGRVQNGRRT